MRGKEEKVGKQATRRRITPAYAGKRKTLVLLLAMSEDHPRLCGEKPQTVAQRRSDRGSPPPMRGKGTLSIDFCTFVGITPAYAGKSTHRHFLFLRI